MLAYGAGIAWTLFYDTIYAHQDKEDDALIGVKSTARLFGKNSRAWLRGFMIVAMALLGAAIVVTPLGPERFLAMVVALIGVWGFGAHMMWQMRRLDMDDPASCMVIFRSNRDAGLIVALFLAVAVFL